MVKVKTKEGTWLKLNSVLDSDNGTLINCNCSNGIYLSYKWNNLMYSFTLEYATLIDLSY